MTDEHDREPDDAADRRHLEHHLLLQLLRHRARRVQAAVESMEGLAHQHFLHDAHRHDTRRSHRVCQSNDYQVSHISVYRCKSDVAAVSLQKRFSVSLQKRCRCTSDVVDVHVCRRSNVVVLSL